MKTSDHPSLPYNGKSGHIAASKTSTARAVFEDSSGVTSKRQLAILAALDAAPYGKTWKELSADLNVHHGSISGALSVLHKCGRVFALKQTRDNSQIYHHNNRRSDFNDAERLDFPVKTAHAQASDALDALLTAVDVLVDCQTMETVAAVRHANEMYKAAKHGV